MMLFLLAAIAGGLTGQTYEVRPLLKVGQEFQLRVSRETPQPSLPKPVITRTPVHVKVLAVSPAGTTLEWDYDDPTYENVPPELKASIGGIQSVMHQVRLEPVLDAGGRFQSLSNWDHVVAESRSIIEAASKQLEGAPPEQVKKLMEEALTPENVAIEIRNYFGFSGLRLQLHKPVLRAETTPAPMNLGQLQMNVSIEMTELKDTEVTIVSRAESDPASERKLAQALAEKLLPPDERINLDLSRFSLQVQETATALVDRRSGLVKRMERHYSIEAGPQRMAFSELIEMVSAPKLAESK
jgi:hypothetical protein